MAWCARSFRLSSGAWAALEGLQRTRFGGNDSRAVRRARIAMQAGAVHWVEKMCVADRFWHGCGAMTGAVTGARRVPPAMPASGRAKTAQKAYHPALAVVCRRCSVVFMRTDPPACPQKR